MVRLEKDEAAAAFIFGSLVAAFLLVLIGVAVLRKHYWRSILLRRVEAERAQGGRVDTSTVDRSLTGHAALRSQQAMLRKDSVSVAVDSGLTYAENTPAKPV